MANKNIYLVGFMGTGKSTIGKELARAVGRKYLDIDQALEQRWQMSINEMFAVHGEAWFRLREHEMCQEIALLSNRIVASGGGTLLNDDNFTLFCQSGTIICLYASRNCLVDRLKRSTRRPLLQDNVEIQVDKLLQERHNLYDKIRIRIDTTDCTPMETAKRLAELLRSHNKLLNGNSKHIIDLR